MDEDNKNQLISLRAEILQDMLPLVESSELDPTQKFELLFSAARVSDDPSRYRAAYEILKQIDDSGTKTNAMLDMLDALDRATAVAVAQPQPASDNQSI